MSDINGLPFQNEDDFNPFHITPFAEKVLLTYKDMVNEHIEQQQPLEISEILTVIAGIYTQLRESVDAEFLNKLIPSALYITEQVIQKNIENYPGRYPNSREEAELKFEIEQMFHNFNENE